MIKHLGLILVATFALLLGGCTTVQNMLGMEEPVPCVQNVAMAEATIDVVIKQANTAYKGDLIELETFEKIDVITDQAYAASTSALNLCAADESAAESLLATVGSFVAQSQQLLKPPDEEN